jgi:hypothetical protein
VNPLAVEQLYQRLRMSLSLPGTPLQRLLEVRSFLCQLDGEVDAFESYAIDCAQEFVGAAAKFTPGGHHPAVLTSILDSIVNAERELPRLTLIPGYSDTILRLTRAAALQYAYAGALPEAIHVIDPKISAEFVAGILTEDIPVTDGPFRMLRAAIVGARDHGAEQLCSDLEPIEGEWRRRLEDEGEGVFVPVVEVPLRQSENGLISGSLRLVSARVTPFPGATADEFVSDVPVYGVSRNEHSIHRTPTLAARNLLQQTRPAAAGSFYMGQVVFDDRDALHAGGSANLAIAGLAYAGILKAAGERSSFRFRPTVAITGDIDAHGSVLPVDEDSLPVKIAAMFFSHLTTAVVPAAQHGQAVSAVESLRSQFPLRSLDVLPASTLADLFRDSRIAN